MWGLLGVMYVAIGAVLLVSVATTVSIGAILAICVIAVLGFAWATSD
jgi:hypothetical protein